MVHAGYIKVRYKISIKGFQERQTNKKAYLNQVYACVLLLIYRFVIFYDLFIHIRVNFDSQCVFVTIFLLWYLLLLHV